MIVFLLRLALKGVGKIFFLSTIVFLFFSCTDEDAGSECTFNDEILISESYLIPDKETKVVSTVLNFKNLDAIDYLMVSKSGGDFYSVKIERDELSLNYEFNYKIQQSDPDFLD